MQIEKECEPYLKSHDVINILQSGNETFKTRVLNCINKYRNLICSNIFFTHKLIETELLNMCREIAFQDAQLIFITKVIENKFAADYDTCLPFIKEIFRKRYWGEYQKELRRKMVLTTIPNQTSANDFAEGAKEIKESIQIIVSTFNEQEQQIYKMYYEEGFKLKEISDFLGLQYQTLREKSGKICRAISNNWKVLNK